MHLVWYVPTLSLFLVLFSESVMNVVAKTSAYIKTVSSYLQTNKHTYKQTNGIA